MSTRAVPDHVLINGRKLKESVFKNLKVLNITYTITLLGFVYLVISTTLPISIACASVFLLSILKYFLDRLFIKTCFIDQAVDALIDRTKVS